MATTLTMILFALPETRPQGGSRAFTSGERASEPEAGA